MEVKYLRSNHSDTQFEQNTTAYLQQLSNALGEEVRPSTGKAFAPSESQIFYIASGGTEELFVRDYSNVKGPVYLLTMPSRNSLAASMEILAWMRERNIPGEILHGTPAEIAAKLKMITRAAAAKKALQSMRFGVTKPSGWLIASGVDPSVMKEVSGAELVTIPMAELMAETAKNTYQPNPFTDQLKKKAFPGQEIEKALYIYGGVKRLVEKYRLQGISIKCFDLLEPCASSGCLALAILNAEGIYAACEGDQRSLLSMAVIGQLTGQPVFMANPARLNLATREAVFAHCVLPLQMPDKYELLTHYESGIGVAIAADLPKDRCTIFKTKEDFKEFVALEGTLTDNLHEGDMCRTQVRIALDEPLDYFLTRPIANHHMIVMGEHKELVRTFMAQY